MSVAIATMGAAVPVFDLSFLDAAFDDTSGATTTYGIQFRFNTNGTVDVLRTVGSDVIPVGRCSIPMLSALWIRCTVSLTALNVGTAGTWQQLTSARTFGHLYTSGGGADSVNYDWTFELATDSGGSNIVASGNPTGEIGELF